MVLEPVLVQRQSSDVAEAWSTDEGANATNAAIQHVAAPLFTMLTVGMEVMSDR